jgi:hypothetical protein
MMYRVCTTILTLVMIFTRPVLAQNLLPAAPANPTVPVAPPNAPSLPPEQVAPANGDLSGQLSRNKGTIAPPNVDPGMAVKPTGRATSTTPVIPPPGTPGGNTSVVPK